MKTKYFYLFFMLLNLYSREIFSQKGLPSKVPTEAVVNTVFPQHEDFKESLVSRLVVPKGFKVTVAATGLGKPRMMAMGANGTLYITRRDQGDVLLLKDTDNDGKFDEMKTALSKFTGVHGIAIHDGELYLCSNRELKKAKIKSDGMPESAVTLISDLPDGGQHPNRTLAFGPDGMLYITVGSTCNDCNESNPENATIVQTKPDGSSRRIFARGLRNTIGIDWHPQTKELWGADNGTDWRGDDLPHEELNKITDGGHYGWPLVYENQQVDPTREDPIGSTKEAFAKTTTAPSLLFPAHSAPINFTFLEKAGTFPSGYQNDALVTLHGSWNRKNPEGYLIKRIHFEKGQPVSQEDFLTGFLSNDKKTRFGRPAGLVVFDKGVYVSDDENGVIYRITTTN